MIFSKTHKQRNEAGQALLRSIKEGVESLDPKDRPIYCLPGGRR